MISFATISAPLWDLTSKNAKWKWGSKEAAAFSQIKHLLNCAPVMAYYNQNAKTRITMDASPVGLGAIIEQEQPDGHFHPVYYASRKLSKTEQRYSQFKREALAVKWACEKFFLFLYGTKFEIRTDHKALITVPGPNSKPPSARIERWLLYLQQFRYNVTHIQGKYNSGNVLSRLPVGRAKFNDPAATKVYACSVASQAVSSFQKRSYLKVNPRCSSQWRLDTSFWYNVQSYIWQDLGLGTNRHARQSYYHAREPVETDIVTSTRGAPRNCPHEITITRKGMVAKHEQTGGTTTCVLNYFKRHNRQLRDIH